MQCTNTEDNKGNKRVPENTERVVKLHCIERNAKTNAEKDKEQIKKRRIKH